MWISLLGFSVATVLLGWLLCGYAVWLRLLGDSRRRVELLGLDEHPTLSIVVPCLNEARFIADKYRNITACAYPADRLEVVFADGGSTDHTVGVLEALTAADGRVRIVQCPEGGKIHQLNHVLPTLGGDVVVVTDTDARLANDALLWIAAEFEADGEVALVGACTFPRGHDADGLRPALPVERCYWSAQNRVRLLESKVAHVPIVTACCYAFRRELLARFPEDVIADDVYAALLANTQGRRTTYSARATVEELRTPASLPQFLSHKYRKANAVLREMLRFCYRLPEMNNRWKSVFTTCLAQQLLLPWVTAMWIALAATLANLGQLDVIGLAVGGLFVSLLAARRAALSVELPGGDERFGVLTVVQAFCYALAVVFAAALTYTFFRQDSRYARLGDRRESARPTQRKAESATMPAPAPGRSARLNVGRHGDDGVPAGFGALVPLAGQTIGGAP